MERTFFISKETINDKGFTIKGNDARHISVVLRMGKGDVISLLTGDGVEYVGEIDNSAPDNVTGHIISRRLRETEPSVRLTLVQCLPKTSKMELIIQKCVELGIAKIIPAVSDRSLVKVDEKKARTKIQRWRRISEEAGKQCGRALIPEVSEIRSFEEALKDVSKSRYKILPYELEKNNTLKSFLITSLEKNKTGPVDMVFCIGPEGGLTDAEVVMARENGFVPVTLGPRILRTETAGMVVTACIMYHMDQMEYKSDR